MQYILITQQYLSDFLSQVIHIIHCHSHRSEDVATGIVYEQWEADRQGNIHIVYCVPEADSIGKRVRGGGAAFFVLQTSCRAIAQSRIQQSISIFRLQALTAGGNFACPRLATGDHYPNIQYKNFVYSCNCDNFRVYRVH